MARDARGTGSNPMIAILLSLALIGSFAISIAIPAGAYPMPPMHCIDMGFDAGMTAILALLLVQLGRAPGGLAGWRAVLGRIAVAAAVGSFLIRVTSTHGWWTGRELPPLF